MQELETRFTADMLLKIKYAIAVEQRQGFGGIVQLENETFAMNVACYGLLHNPVVVLV